MISVFQGWPRKIPGSYTLVAGFLICQYTVQYTSCILRETGGILAGLWVACVASVPVRRERNSRRVREFFPFGPRITGQEQKC